MEEIDEEDDEDDDESESLEDIEEMADGDFRWDLKFLHPVKPIMFSCMIMLTYPETLGCKVLRSLRSHLFLCCWFLMLVMLVLWE